MKIDIQQDIAGRLYCSRAGLDFCEELVERFGSRFGGSKAENDAASFLKGRFEDAGLSSCALESFECPGWTRRETRLVVTKPVAREVSCIALPYCPTGDVAGRLVYVGGGDPQDFTAHADEIRGAIAMVSSGSPAFSYRPMHRAEKVGRVLERGAIGIIWMRGSPGGLAETGSTPFGHSAPVPVIGVSYEVGHELLRLGRSGGLEVRITSTNENRTVTSFNAVGELKGTKRPGEIIVVGGHYDGHDISQGATDNASGIAGVLEAARALVPYRKELSRTVRFVGFAQEEMGLHGAAYHVQRHQDENIRFMLNHDGGARSVEAMLKLHGCPEGVSFVQRIFDDFNDSDVIAGEGIALYMDSYPFLAHCIPCGTLQSRAPMSGASVGARRGFGHTAMDTLDKVSAKYVQIDAIRIACLAYELATREDLPFRRRTVSDVKKQLAEQGLDTVLRLEQRAVPGEA